MNHQEFSSKGGKASALKLTPEERKARSKKAINTRWKNRDTKAIKTDENRNKPQTQKNPEPKKE